ncbi:4'-phosphopantetheinyl transferase superfamily protein [Mycoplasma anserisalpingitidis]|uniref:4'-phosphopantetheinyl transferase superfamily protein n=1 Tax=Mycoplasma anserisalpingitidis TaxID=519450 RepID=A0A5B8JXN0_9MOLU|nr:4'-phosphopantetheinyl transferase superfamily protein [Mycoplasma anserisalpingitidis]QDY87039.1 4'-phosphopantetheinyl transferase superfamily protein [Mycoplasma anserisalpingitidis]
MIGVDIVKISRFIDNYDKFAKRILTQQELDEYQKIVEIRNKIKYVAVHWSIKEAIYKADNNYSTFNKINITKENSAYMHENFYISTSDDGDNLVAFVIKKG